MNTVHSETQDMHTSRNLVSLSCSQHRKQDTYLGKLYIANGTEITKNDIGVALNFVPCEMDRDLRTRISDNN
jgi:hypothetical protein